MLTSIASLLVTTALSWAPTTTVGTQDGYLLSWAGHQVSYGSREIPFRGEVTTRVDSLVLARVKFDGNRMILVQDACAVRFAEVGGVQVHMDATALPPTRMRFDLQPDGETFTAKSLVSWGEEDVDGDGNPGMTVEVDAPVCAGDLYVSNRSRTRAEGWFDAEHFRGNAKVKVEQEVLGAKGRCLGVVARNTAEVVSGPFAYVNVPRGTTCASLIRDGWPVDAES